MHAAIVQAIRSHLAASPDIMRHFESWSDEYIIRQLFRNYRDGHGLRLSFFGQQIMQVCFKSFEFTTEINEELHPAYLLFLDKHAKMPYYWQNQKLIVYDMKFAMWLRLAGSLPTLLEIDIE